VLVFFVELICTAVLEMSTPRCFYVLPHSYEGLISGILGVNIRFTLRMCLMLIMGGLGVQLGVYIQTRILRDRLQLVLFGFDQGI